MVSTDTGLAIFSYIGHDVRTVLIGDDVHIVVSDLARILGYRSAADAARLLRDRHIGYAEVRTHGGIQKMLVTDEAGFNRLILRSNAKNAEEVQDWVTDVVLPEIRQTGSYNAPAAPVELSRMEILTMALESEHRAVAAEGQVAELEPRAGAWDALASAKGDYSVGDAAKMLARAGIPTGPTRLFGQLATLKWTFRGGDGVWRAYADRVADGCLAEKPSSHYHPKTGEQVVDPPQIRVTIKGLERLRQRLHVGALAAVPA